MNTSVVPLALAAPASLLAVYLRRCAVPRFVARAMREVVWFPVAFAGAVLLNAIA